MKQRRLTQVPMVFLGVRVKRAESELYTAAAAIEGVSQSEFLRRAFRERAAKILKPHIENDAAIGTEESR